LEREDVVERELRGPGVLVEERAELPVARRVELEVVRANRLSFGDDVDELRLRHRCERVVERALFTDRRARLGGKLLPA
jgi:hypothetical protein